jgi:hypothetical protein
MCWTFCGSACRTCVAPVVGTGPVLVAPSVSLGLYGFGAVWFWLLRFGGVLLSLPFVCQAPRVLWLLLLLLQGLYAGVLLSLLLSLLLWLLVWWRSLAPLAKCGDARWVRVVLDVC